MDSTSNLYIAKSAFVTVENGVNVRVYVGTVVEAGHWLLDRAPDSFKPLVIDYPAGAPANPAGVQRLKPVPGDTTVNPEPEPDDTETDTEDLGSLTRPELNAIAEGLGVEAPEKLANKGEVIAVIEKARAGG